MKLHFELENRDSKRPEAFTLPELIIAIAVLVMLVGGLVSANLFGLRMFQISQTKLTASDSVRKAISRMRDEIRGSKSAFVGNVTTNGDFVALADGVNQAGTSMLISNANSSAFTVYFINQSDQTLRRTTSTPGTTTILAQSVTNSTAFSALDFAGNVLTNSGNNKVFHITFEFYQAQNLGTPADSYRLETSVTRRAPR